jgi:hypothetical protein
MTEAHIKEELSRIFVDSLAAFKGFTVSKPERDYGVDLRIEAVERFKINGKTRFTHIGKAVDVQLKATSAQQKAEHGFINFDLVVENYNDLILRRNAMKHLSGGHTPLILIVVFLPEERNEWLKLNELGIFLSGNAFWFYPENEMELSTNNRTQRIKISLKNQMNFDFFDVVLNLNQF